jgi:nicotinate phosphoribosyltransferase
MDARPSVLLTDLYQLTMLQAYVEKGMGEPAVFELFVRKLPPSRGFLMAAGLEQLLEYLEQLRFLPEEVEWLRTTGRFSTSLLDYLATLRFTGDVHAMPEGTIFFPDEPIVRITAPLPQAQLVETRLMNLVHFQTVVASKAARSVLAAAGKPLIDFGLRRAHGAEAGLLAARAAYVAGFSGTATVLAQRLFGIPVYGTMAHSFIQAHQNEAEAFRDFAETQPENVVLLIDTYDTEAAARLVVSLAPRLKEQGLTIHGVRLDSGDLADHARKVRRILDDGGLHQVQIVASGSLDEYLIERMVQSATPIDSFAVGTSLTTSADAPYLDCAYKLQEYAGQPRRKRSEHKSTWPGPKQVYRHYDAQGLIAHDVVTTADDRQEGEALVQPVMRAGRRLGTLPALIESRRRAALELARLPAAMRQLREPGPYPVHIGQALRDLAKLVDERTETR